MALFDGIDAKDQPLALLTDEYDGWQAMFASWIDLGRYVTDRFAFFGKKLIAELRDEVADFHIAGRREAVRDGEGVVPSPHAGSYVDP